MKARYARSRWWVTASAIGAFAAMFGALFAHDRDVVDAQDAADATPLAQPLTQQSSLSTRRVLPNATTQQSSRQVQPLQPGSTAQMPHTRTRAS